MNRFQRYFDAIAYIEGLSNMPLQGDYMIDVRHSDIYLKRMRYFLDLIGNPGKHAKYIHVTGTAGKGSVTNMLHELILAGGKKVGSFTSPFVTTAIEKIRVGELYIGPDEFADIVEYLKPFIDEAYLRGPYGRPSFFEIFFAVAMLYFEKKKCEWVVLEVGLGGRYDATNVVEKPVVTAITNIDYDHMEVLGKTLKKIGYDKAGIIKKGSTFFTNEQRPALLRMFKEICSEKKATFVHVPRQPDFKTSNRELVSNIARHIGVDSKAIAKGIAAARLQCRFEKMQDSPLVVLDGAHNRIKVESTVKNLKALKYDKLHLVIGMAQDKDYDSMLEQLVPLADRLYITRFQTTIRKSAHPKELVAKASEFIGRSKIQAFLDPMHALRAALKNARKNDLVLVAGSFYLAGELRQLWVSEEKILKHRRLVISS